MTDKKKVTSIKYKQMDKDPEIKHVTNEMEKHFFGDAGVGLLDALGLSPGRTQKYFDDQFDQYFELVTTKYKDYIINERTTRGLAIVEKWLNDNKGSTTAAGHAEQFQKAVKEAEAEIIEELMKKEGYL